MPEPCEPTILANDSDLCLRSIPSANSEGLFISRDARLFSDAKLTEDSIEDVIGVDHSQDDAQMIESVAQVDGDEFVARPRGLGCLRRVKQ